MRHNEQSIIALLCLRGLSRQHWDVLRDDVSGMKGFPGWDGDEEVGEYLGELGKILASQVPCFPVIQWE